MSQPESARSATRRTLSAKETGYIGRLKDRIGILKQRKRGSQLRDTQEITKELHALEWAVEQIESGPRVPAKATSGNVQQRDAEVDGRARSVKEADSLVTGRECGAQRLDAGLQRARSAESCGYDPSALSFAPSQSGEREVDRCPECFHSNRLNGRIVHATNCSLQPYPIAPSSTRQINVPDRARLGQAICYVLNEQDLLPGEMAEKIIDLLFSAPSAIEAPTLGERAVAFGEWWDAQDNELPFGPSERAKQLAWKAWNAATDSGVKT